MKAGTLTPMLCTFGLSGCRVKPSKNTTKIQREDTQRDTKRAMGRGEGKKKREIFGPPPFGPPLFLGSGPHPSALHWVWARGLHFKKNKLLKIKKMKKSKQLTLKIQTITKQKKQLKKIQTINFKDLKPFGQSRFGQSRFRPNFRLGPSRTWPK